MNLGTGIQFITARIVSDKKPKTLKKYSKKKKTIKIPSSISNIFNIKMSFYLFHVLPNYCRLLRVNFQIPLMIKAA